jgi:hypothetical protein
VIKASHIDIRSTFLPINYQNETINKNDIKYFQSSIKLKIHSLKGSLEQVVQKAIKMVEFYLKYCATKKERERVKDRTNLLQKKRY